MPAQQPSCAQQAPKGTPTGWLQRELVERYRAERVKR